MGGVAVSLVVVVFDMPREAPRTLATLAPGRQRDVAADEYEVVVVENGSTRPLPGDVVAALPPNFRYVRHVPASPSPVAALNHGIALARGEWIGLLIDGARMASPGLVARAREAMRLADEPVVATLGFHLGPDVQRRSIVAGYDRGAEDALLATVPWEADGYELFRIAALAEASADGWFRPLAEINALFLRRRTLERLGGGLDPAFDLPGGGFANMDLFRRACELPGTTLVVLLGEGTFHQVHGGVATNRRGPDGDALLARFAAQYEALRGEPFRRPAVVPRCYGIVPPQCASAVRESIERLAPSPGVPGLRAAAARPIPVVVCVDVECDDRHVARTGRPPWRGYEAAVAGLAALRPGLEAATGRPARFAWFHRLDPAVADGYGTPTWPLTGYPALRAAVEAAGDAIGLHVHAARWDAGDGAWVIDHGDPAWVAHCVRTGFAAYREALGRDCELYRGGDRYLDAATVALIESLGARIDLTVEPGLPPWPLGNLTDRRTGTFPDYGASPRVPFQPSRADFRDAAADGREGLWMLPVTSAAIADGAPRPQGPWYRPVSADGDRAIPYVRLALWDAPATFARVVERVLDEDRPAPHLVALMRSDQATRGAWARVRANLDFLRTHPLAARFAFTTPADALAMLEPGAAVGDLGRRVVALEAELATRRRELDWIETSRSWRYTAPARRWLAAWRGARG